MRKKGNENVHKRVIGFSSLNILFVSFVCGERFFACRQFDAITLDNGASSSDYYMLVIKSR